MFDFFRSDSLELLVIDQHHDHIGLLQRLSDWRQRHVTRQRLRQLFNVRFHRQRLADVPFGNQMRDLYRRAFTQIVDIRLEGQAEAGNFDLGRALVGGGQAIGHRRFHPVDHPQRFTVVHQASGVDQARLLRVLRHDKPRIDSDAVTADARPRLQNIHPRMAVRQADQFPRR